MDGMDKKTLMEYREGMLRFVLIQSAEKVGLYEALREPTTSEALAQRMGFDPRAVRTVLLALQSLEMVEEYEGQFVISESGKRMFIQNSTFDYVGSSHRHSLNILRNWIELPTVLQTGKPARRGPEPANPQEGIKAFMHAMNSRPAEEVDRVVHACFEKAPDLRRILDLGGGPGQYAKAFAKSCDRVTLFDLPEVIDTVAETFGLSEIPDLTLQKGDMSQTLPEEPFDLVFLGNVCHMFSPQENADLFKRIASILRPGGVLGVLEFVRGFSNWAPLFAVNMLVNTESGNTYAFVEYWEWLEKAGFKEIEIQAAGPDSQIILAVKTGP